MDLTSYIVSCSLSSSRLLFGHSLGHELKWNQHWSQWICRLKFKECSFPLFYIEIPGLLIPMAQTPCSTAESFVKPNRPSTASCKVRCLKIGSPKIWSLIHWSSLSTFSHEHFYFGGVPHFQTQLHGLFRPAHLHFAGRHGQFSGRMEKPGLYYAPLIDVAVAFHNLFHNTLSKSL